MMLKDYVEALRNGNGYQYICDNGHNMDKSELCDIIKEFDYVVGQLSNSNIGSNDYYGYVAESIEEFVLIEEE